MWDGPSGCEFCGLADGAGCWANPEAILQKEGGNGR